MCEKWGLSVVQENAKFYVSKPPSVTGDIISKEQHSKLSKRTNLKSIDLLIHIYKTQNIVICFKVLSFLVPLSSFSLK